MATWGVHLRVARCFIDNAVDKEHHREFVIGSVAPDCGYGVKDSFGEFTPPPQITHWSPSGMKRDCRYKDFQKEYLTDKASSDYWFYLGYYVHLLTDIMWSVTMYMPTRVKYAEEYKKNPEFLKVIKKDWNDIDVWHLRSITYHPTFDILKNAGEIKDYLPYYEHNQLTTQIKFIVDYYESYKSITDRKFEYTQKEDIQNFVDCSYELLNKVLKEKELI